MDTSQADILSAYSADQGENRRATVLSTTGRLPCLLGCAMVLSTHICSCVYILHLFPSGFQETTVDNVHEALQQSLAAEPLLLDVRTPQEYQSGHATKAVNIELDVLSEAVKAGTLDDWKEEGPILVICQSGKRSAQATVKLNKVFGFQQVVNVKGGTSAWIAAGYPTEQGDGMTLDAPPHLT